MPADSFRLANARSLALVAAGSGFHPPLTASTDRQLAFAFEQSNVVCCRSHWLADCQYCVESASVMAGGIQIGSLRAAVAGLLATAAAAGQTAPVLTARDAVALALKGNRQVQSAALDVLRAGEETAALRTTRLPQFQIYLLSGELLRAVTFTIPQGALGTFAATGPIPAHNQTVTQPRQFAGFILGQVMQPVSQLWKIRLALISSQIREELAGQRLRQKRQETVESVRELYQEIAQSQVEIEAAEANVKTLLALQTETDRQLVEMAVLKSDSLAVTARLSQQRYQLLKLRDTSQTQKESLNRLLGRDLQTEFSVEVEPPPAAEEIDLPAAQSLALRQRPEIQQSRLEIKEAETELRRQHAEYIPDVSVGFTYASFPNVSFMPQNFMSTGVLLQWEPFDWGRKRHKANSLRAGVKQSMLAGRETEQQVLLEVNSKFRALAEARMLLDTAALQQQEHREKLRETMNLYREKAVLLSGALQEQAAVVQADSEYRSALAAFWKAKAQFDRALGREF
ncbi:MAG TPA: TolC family protein [Bryobacteraceae bacterium]|nr:TolC family protein [Bryobacteraceae bacterium]